MDLDYTDMMSVLRWLAGPAGMLWWAIEWSDIVENLQKARPGFPLGKVGIWLSMLPPFKRQMLVVVGYAVLPGAVALILTYLPEETLMSLQPLWEYFTLLVMGWMAVKVRHSKR